MLKSTCCLINGACPVPRHMSPGAGVGQIVFTAEDAIAWKKRGEDVVLVREDTSPDDVGGMHAAKAILTQRGGMTSHAAVVGGSTNRAGSTVNCLPEPCGQGLYGTPQAFLSCLGIFGGIGCSTHNVT